VVTPARTPSTARPEPTPSTPVAVPTGDRLLPGDDARVDVLRGGPGPDRIFARTGRGLNADEQVKGRDRVYAGAGNDVVTVVKNWGWYMPYIDCGAGHDTVRVPFRMIATLHCEHIVKRR
jgi:hypothetical protein